MRSHDDNKDEFSAPELSILIQQFSGSCLLGFGQDKMTNHLPNVLISKINCGMLRGKEKVVNLADFLQIIVKGFG